jgi:hypothetical protein
MARRFLLVFRVARTTPEVFLQVMLQFLHYVYPEKSNLSLS